MADKPSGSDRRQILEVESMRTCSDLAEEILMTEMNWTMVQAIQDYQHE
jgi:hypothetical protein